MLTMYCMLQNQELAGETVARCCQMYLSQLVVAKLQQHPGSTNEEQWSDLPSH